MCFEHNFIELNEVFIYDKIKLVYNVKIIDKIKYFHLHHL